MRIEEEAKRAAQIIEKKIPHQNAKMLYVFGEISLVSGSIDTTWQEILREEWRLTEVENGTRRNIPLDGITNPTLTAYAPRIARSFGLPPESTTICLIQESTFGLADITAAVFDPKSGSHKKVTFGINEKDEIVKKAT